MLKPSKKSFLQSEKIMRNWPNSEKPCEKLLRHGAHFLSDVELLAILIRSGQKNNSVLQIARVLIKQFGSLRGIINADKAALCAIPGIGDVKYAQIQASLEIIKRQYEEPLRQSNVFNSCDEVKKYLRCQLRDKTHEEFAVLMLDNQHRLLSYRTMFTGTINAAAVYPREIVKQALADNAAATILVHNHPSGGLEPSQADIGITKEIKQALELIDVSLLDHFIVADNKTASFAQRGLI